MREWDRATIIKQVQATDPATALTVERFVADWHYGRHIETLPRGERLSFRDECDISQWRHEMARLIGRAPWESIEALRDADPLPNIEAFAKPYRKAQRKQRGRSNPVEPGTAPDPEPIAPGEPQEPPVGVVPRTPATFAIHPLQQPQVRFTTLEIINMTSAGLVRLLKIAEEECGGDIDLLDKRLAKISSWCDLEVWVHDNIRRKAKKETEKEVRRTATEEPKVSWHYTNGKYPFRTLVNGYTLIVVNRDNNRDWHWEIYQDSQLVRSGLEHTAKAAKAFAVRVASGLGRATELN